jgi:hypothetical protein
VDNSKCTTARTPSQLRCTASKFSAGVIDTGGKFSAGVTTINVDRGKHVTANFNVTSGLQQVLTELVLNFQPVSTTPAMHL